MNVLYIHIIIATSSILKTGVLIRRDAHGIRGMFYYLLLSFFIFFYLFLFFIIFLLFFIILSFSYELGSTCSVLGVQISGYCIEFLFLVIYFFGIGQYIFCDVGPNFRRCFHFLIFYFFVLGNTLCVLGVQISRYFLYLLCILDFCIAYIIFFFVLGSKFQDMFFYVFLFFVFGNTFFVLGVQNSGYFFLFFFIFCIRQYIFCIGGPNFRIYIFFFYFFLFFSIFFYFFLFFFIFFYFFLFFSIFLFFCIFCIWQYIFCIGGPNFRIFFFIFFNFLLFLFIFFNFLLCFLFFVFGNTLFIMEVQVSGYVFYIFLIRQYLSCHGGPNFRICLFFFSFIYILVCFSCFLMFFVLGNTFFVLGVQFSGYVFNL